jgi:hypothetical protein
LPSHPIISPALSGNLPEIGLVPLHGPPIGKRKPGATGLGLVFPPCGGRLRCKRMRLQQHYHGLRHPVGSSDIHQPLAVVAPLASLACWCVFVRTVLCLEGRVEVELICEPAFDYGGVPASWSVDRGRHAAEASGAEQTIRLRSDLAMGIESNGWQQSNSPLPLADRGRLECASAMTS